MKKCGYACKYKGHIKPTCGCEYCNLLYSQKQAAPEMYEALEEALKAMLINGFNPDCVPVVKLKYALKKARGEL